jgi:hypothetical protein
MWKYTGGMAVMAFLSTLLTQTDKIVISKMMPLQVFGYYTLAGSLAMAPMILASPIGIAVFPRMTGLVSRGDSATLTKIYHFCMDRLSPCSAEGGNCSISFACRTNHAGNHGCAILFSPRLWERQIEPPNWIHFVALYYSLVDYSNLEIWRGRRGGSMDGHEFLHLAGLYVFPPPPFYSR